MTGLYARSVARALGGEAHGRGRVLAPGPGHSPRDRSLLIEIDPAAPEGFTVHTFSALDDWKQGRDYVRQRLGLSSSWRRYPDGRTRRMRLPSRAPSEQHPCDEADDGAKKNSALALRLWHEAGDPRGTVVEARLLRRGIQLDALVAGRVIRYHPSLWHADTRRYLPAMLALFRRIDDDAPVAIHRTFIGPDGRKIGDRKMLGPVAGAVIKLDPDEDVTFGLFTGEGLETSLAARQMGLGPVWATGSSGAIARFPVLPGVEALTVLGEIDRHHTNLKAAHTVEKRWRSAGREVFYAIPQLGKDIKDINDALVGGRADG
jgi:hypothetical protein